MNGRMRLSAAMIGCLGWLAALGPLDGPAGGRPARWEAAWPVYETNPFVIRTEQPPVDDRRGGIIAADVNGDGLMDFLYTTPGTVGAYDHWGKKLWVRWVPIHLTGKAETEGLPGHSAPGVQAADVDGDGAVEVVFLQETGSVAILDGTTGRTKRIARPPGFGEVQKWEAFILCNLRGAGDRDIVLQATNPTGVRSGRYLQAHSLARLEGQPRWRRDDFRAPLRGPARAADLDGDGRDEIVGLNIVRHDGRLVTGWQYPAEGKEHEPQGVYIDDIRPEVPGLEVLLLDEKSNYATLVNMKRGVLWHQLGPEGKTPHVVSVGDFDPRRPGLEIWCRSLGEPAETPWVFDARGNVIAHWRMAEAAPAGWTDQGVDGNQVVDWEGSGPRYCAAKERHRAGDICVFDPMTGRFLRRWPEKAERIFVADVAGDWREEILVVSGSEIHVYWNAEPNAHPPRPRYWAQQCYRRNKANWCFYSP